MIKSKIAPLVITVLLIVNIILFWYINLRIISVDDVVIKETGLENVLDGLTIVHLSDLHTRGLTAYEKGLTRVINELEADIIFITGDMTTDSSAVNAAISFVSCLNARYGIFFVPGNYDHYYELNGKPRMLFDGLERAGVNVLRNRTVKGSVFRKDLFEGEFYISGIDDRVSYYDDLDAALSGLQPGIPVILLSHTPIILNRAAGKGINVVVSGHTHGGQVNIPYVTRYVTASYYVGSYMEGLHSRENTQIFINRGMGTSLIPVRFFSRPQIAVLRFV